MRWKRKRISACKTDLRAALLPDCAAEIESGREIRTRHLKFSTGGSKGCIAGQLIGLIDVDGNVLPCSYFPKSAGNIRTQSFKDIWENSQLV